MAKATCDVTGCTNPGPIRRGWCDLHYNRWYFHGDPLWEPPQYQNRGATCRAEEPCDKPARTKGLCKNHYYRLRTHGTTAPLPTLSPAERLWANTNKNGPIPAHWPELGPCWVPASDDQQENYGRIWVDGENVLAHRFAYELEVRPIPDDLVIDHLCRNPPCRNPAHLEPVTQGVNTLRGEGPSAVNALKTHCPKGHPYDEENTYYEPDGKGRQCKTCSRERQREAYALISKGLGLPGERTHCPLGHPYDEENTYVDPSGRRSCRICKRRRLREWRERQAS
jgi:HNH endonuclease